MGDYPFGAMPALQRQSGTPIAGFALQNGTPTILSWTAPNDGQVHRVLLMAQMYVSSSLTGGQIVSQATVPVGFQKENEIIGASASGPEYYFPQFLTFMIEAGSTFSLIQNSAVTAGAATIWAEIWGS